MNQLSSSGVSSGRPNTKVSSWNRSLPGDWLGTPSYLSCSQQNSVWSPFKNSVISTQPAGAKLLRLDSQGYDDYSSFSATPAGTEPFQPTTSNSNMASVNFEQNSELNVVSIPSHENHWLSFRSVYRGGFGVSDAMWPRSSMCDKVACSSIKFPVQSQVPFTSTLLSKVQLELCMPNASCYMPDVRCSCSESSKPPVINPMVCEMQIDREAPSCAAVNTDLPDKWEKISWHEDVQTCQKEVNKVSTNQHVTCQPRFLCRRKNFCSRFSDKRVKCIITKRMSNVWRATVSCSVDAYHRAPNGITHVMSCNSVDYCDESAELNKCGASLYSSVSAELSEKSDRKCLSQPSDTSSFFVSPCELDSDEDESCDDDWSTADTSYSSVPVCSFGADNIQSFLLQAFLPTSSESDIESAEDELDGNSRPSLQSCSKNCNFQLDVVNAKWNECYAAFEAFDHQSDCLQREQKVGFCDEISFVPILNGTEWADDYSAARCGLWKVDQLRFNHRISEVEQQIGWVFSEEHRVKWLAVTNRQYT